LQPAGIEPRPQGRELKILGELADTERVGITTLRGGMYMRRIKRTITVGLALALLSIGLAVAPAQAGPAGSFVSKMNSERAARGLAPLQVYADLTDDAKAHSQRMMSQDDLHHNPNLAGVTTGWQALAENVGVGPSVDSLHRAFMASPGHNKNIVGNYNYVGVGVVIESDTKMWVTVVFMRGPADLLEPPPPSDDPPPAEDPQPAEDPPPAEKPKSSQKVKAEVSTPPEQPSPDPVWESLVRLSHRPRPV
jgi:hypothetical protein